MKKILLLLVCLVGFTSTAQTSKELIGKWKLVKWTQHGKEKDIKSTFKSDQVFQLFLANGEFQSIVGDEIHKSKWKLSKDNSELTIISTLIIPIKFHIDYFDTQKRVITSDIMGTLEYQKAEN
ncbi:hypothetical protein [Flavobacterium pedocola]